MIKLEKIDGNIFSVYADGRRRCIYKPEWHDLTLFFTNDCNSRCIMCPQISDETHGNYLVLNKAVLDLEPDGLEQIGITGGEPTLYKEDLVELLTDIHARYSEMPISLLTNGRNFIDANFVEQIANVRHRLLLICIPLYAANYEQHNEIVGVRDAFQQTIRGVFNLYRSGLPIEIRVVVFKHNYRWLTDFAHFIYRNLPFVAHVAFMGMEYTGNAAINAEHFWIDPYHYRNELALAVNYLAQRRMHASVYNIPLCLLNEETRQFARDSISAWKKRYFAECENCGQRESCGGWFDTSVFNSEFIRPIDK